MNYKTYNNVKYISSFPDSWIFQNINGTGPCQCENCFNYGCIDNIFIGYCANCSEHIYNFERGDGFHSNCAEIILENIGPFSEYIEKEKFNIISYLEKKIPKLFWNCEYCTCINYSNSYKCASCKNFYNYSNDNILINSFNDITIE